MLILLDFVADVERKWIDNFLSRVDIAGAESSGHGVVRRTHDWRRPAHRPDSQTRPGLGLTIERSASLAGRLIAERR